MAMQQIQNCAEAMDILPTFLNSAECPEVNDGEIDWLYIGVIGQGFTDWELAAEWTSRLGAPEVGSEQLQIVKVQVVGDRPRPTAATKEISGGRKIALPTDYAINFTIDETNATNHAAIQRIKKGGNFQMWYSTSGGKMFGGNDGLQVFIDADMMIPRSKGESIVYEGTASWKAKNMEDMIVSPIA